MQATDCVFVLLSSLLLAFSIHNAVMKHQINSGRHYLACPFPSVNVCGSRDVNEEIEVRVEQIKWKIENLILILGQRRAVAVFSVCLQSLCVCALNE